MTDLIMASTFGAGFAFGLTLFLPVIFGLMAVRILLKLKY